MKNIITICPECKETGYWVANNIHRSFRCTRCDVITHNKGLFCDKKIEKANIPHVHQTEITRTAL